MTQSIYAKAVDAFNYSSAYIEAFHCFGDTSNCIDPDGKIPSSSIVSLLAH